MLSFWKTFQNILNYASTSNIQEDMKFYKIGDKSFETDFSVAHYSLFFVQFMISFGFKILLNHCWLLDAIHVTSKPLEKAEVGWVENITGMEHSEL